MSAAPGAAGRRVVVLGGTSEIALAIVAELQRRSAREVVLAGRDATALEACASRLRDAGALRVETVRLDALEHERVEEALDDAFAALGGADLVIVAVGVLGARGEEQLDARGAARVLEVNAAGTGALLVGAARRLRDGGGGTVVVLSSVAAERPRAANYVYGASKAALDALARGLADALHGSGVHVLLVRPGFVKTRMTQLLPAPPLSCEPQDVATAVAQGLERGAAVVWAPRSIRWPMLVMRMLPAPIFRRIRQ